MDDRELLSQTFQRRLSRREVLRLSTLGGLTLVGLAACAPAAPSPTPAPPAAAAAKPAESKPAAAAPAAPAKPKELRKVRQLGAAGVIDSQSIFNTVGQHPRLGYYAEDGIEIEQLTAAGTVQTLQGLMMGQGEIAAVSPPTLLPAHAKDSSIDVKYLWAFVQVPYWPIVVNPESPLKELKELKGKKVGIRGPADTGYLGSQAMLKEIGLDPEKDVEWVTVSAGAPAGTALKNGQIDALAIWDAEYARIENVGFKLRELPMTPGMKNLFGAGWATSAKTIAENPDLIRGYLRGMAKSTVFAATNPEASIRLHWDMYPESKPKGKTDEEAMKEALHIVGVRIDKWFPPKDRKDQRIGAIDPDMWTDQLKFTGTAGQLTDIKKFYDPQFVAAGNDFDRKKIEEQARNFKY